MDPGHRPAGSVMAQIPWFVQTRGVRPPIGLSIVPPQIANIVTDTLMRSDASDLRTNRIRELQDHPHGRPPAALKKALKKGSEPK